MLTQELDAEVDAIVGTRLDPHLVALADGADGNWRDFDGPRWTNATKIVDHGHACQHLKAALEACYGATVDGRAQDKGLRVILRDEPAGIDEVIGELG